MHESQEIGPVNKENICFRNLQIYVSLASCYISRSIIIDDIFTHILHIQTRESQVSLDIYISMMQASNLIIMSLVSVLLLKQRLRLDLSFNLFTTEKKNN